MASNRIDLEELVENWAFKRFDRRASKKERKLIEQNQLSMQTDWKRVKFVHEEPEYDPKPPTPGTGQPINNTIFQTTFSNLTEGPQKYTFRAERTTRSTCELVTEQSFTKGYEASVKIATPGGIMEANAGFKKEMTLTNSEGETVEEEMTWGVDSQIEVKGRHRAEAKMIITEEEFKGKFVVRTRVQGRVRVAFYNLKDNNSFITAMEGGMDQIVAEAAKSGLIQGDTVVSDGATRSVICKTAGRCAFRYGLKQDVIVDQVHL